MKQFLLVCCLLVATSVSYAQQNPVNKATFINSVNQLNTNISQGNLPAAQATWVDIVTMMTQDQEYIKQMLQTAVQDGNSSGQTTYSGRADLQANNYSEAFGLIDDMVANHTALINWLNQYAANIF